MEENVKARVAKLVSIFTVVPIIAFIILTFLYLYDSNLYGQGITWYIIALLFLVFIPISAYPLKQVIPSVRSQGRDGERKVAFIMGVIGFVSGTAMCLLFDAPKGVKIIFLSYLVSGIVLAFINGILKYKASGHACGVAGPVTFSIFFMGWRFWYALLLLPIVFWSRLAMKRHTINELISGALVGVVSTVIVIGIFT